MPCPSQPLPSKLHLKLPPILAEHINAVNAFDTDRIVDTFAADAFVNDNHREIWGTRSRSRQVLCTRRSSVITSPWRC